MNEERDRRIDAALHGGGLNRRRFLSEAGKLGLSAMGSGLFLNTLSTAALADTPDFPWKKHAGQTIRLLLNKHPYTDAIVSYLGNFKKLTGIDVEYDIFPESVYFRKVASTLANGSNEYDVFMTGAYQLWQYGPAGHVVDLNSYLADTQKTAETYRWHEVQANIRDALAWSGTVGEPLGGPGARQWALPIAHELYCLSYNADMFAKVGVGVPQNLPDLIDKAQAVQAKLTDGFGIAMRGSRSWATIHPGYLSGLVNYGGTDFTVENGQLKSAVASDACKQFTGLWIEMAHKAGPGDWPNYNWYDVGQALGAGKAAVMYDADVIGYFQQRGTRQAGNIAYSAFSPNPKASEPTSNIWIWALAMSRYAPHKDAAWYFLQWATGPKIQARGARHEQEVDPVRPSVFENAAYQERLRDDFPGYAEQYRQTISNARIYFTPQPLFFDVASDWAAQLQRIYAHRIPVDEGLEQLADRIDQRLRTTGVT